MAPSLGENLDFYARHGLDDKNSMIGIDYPSRTVSVYFLQFPDTCREPETVRAMLRDLGLGEPSEQMLALARQAVGIYTTLTWDSPKIQRITFAAMVPDARALSERIAALDWNVEKFAKNVPYTYPGPAQACTTSPPAPAASTSGSRRTTSCPRGPWRPGSCSATRAPATDGPSCPGCAFCPFSTVA